MAKQPLSDSDRLAHWLRLAGWSLQEAAEQTGIDRQKLWRYVKGKQPLKAPDVASIATALGIDVPQFWGALEAVA